MGIKVKNVNGTTKNKCYCPSWLAHWKKHSGSITFGCSSAWCFGSAEVGAHVQKVNTSDTSWYIIPLCHSCNKKQSMIEVNSTTTFVSANVSKTCGKRNESKSFWSW